MNLSQMLTGGRTKAPLAATAKQAVIEELLDALVAAGDVQDRSGALAAVLDRERTRTTGIGGGLAIPHGRTPAVKDVVLALGKPSRAVDFQSIDGKGVTLVVLLLSPPQMTGPHIQALAHVSKLLSIDAVRKAIEDARTPEQILKVIAKAEREEG